MSYTNTSLFNVFYNLVQTLVMPPFYFFNFIEVLLRNKNLYIIKMYNVMF